MSLGGFLGAFELSKPYYHNCFPFKSALANSRHLLAFVIMKTNLRLKAALAFLSLSSQTLWMSQWRTLFDDVKHLGDNAIFIRLSFNF